MSRGFILIEASISYIVLSLALVADLFVTPSLLLWLDRRAKPSPVLK